MGKRAIYTLILICLLTGGAGRGEKFWGKKPYTEWTKKEVQKLLFNSPWAKKWSYSPPQTDMISPSRETSLDVGEPNRRVPVEIPTPSPWEKQSREQIYSYISWVSALPLKQAMVRYAQLQNQLLDVIQVERFLNTPESFIRINITTDNPDLLLTTLKEKILKETYLQTKTQKKIQLLDYLPPTRDNKKVAFFIFPREENGKPLLTLEDKEVTFFTQLGNLNLKCKFKLKDMVVNGKLEL